MPLVNKKCTKCKKVKSLTEFWKNKRSKFLFQNQCKKCKSIYSKEYRLKNIDRKRQYDKERYSRNPIRAKIYMIKYKYDLTWSDYNNMVLEQENRCSICYKKFYKSPLIDHDHVNGKVRGFTV